MAQYPTQLEARDALAWSTCYRLVDLNRMEAEDIFGVPHRPRELWAQNIRAALHDARDMLRGRLGGHRLATLLARIYPIIDRVEEAMQA